MVVKLRITQTAKNVVIDLIAVSHHLKVLKYSRIINGHRQGTMNYYYLDPKKSRLGLLKDLYAEARDIRIILR